VSVCLTLAVRDLGMVEGPGQGIRSDDILIDVVVLKFVGNETVLPR
jgi:hypothetical protein